MPYVNLDWKSPYGFKRPILLYVEDEGFDISAFLEVQVIRQGRRRSWTAPQRDLLQKMRELKQIADLVVPLLRSGPCPSRNRQLRRRCLRLSHALYRKLCTLCEPGTCLKDSQRAWRRGL